MKMLLTMILAVLVLASMAILPAFADPEGSETVTVDDLALGIQDCGFVDEGHTCYSVTVSGYNVLLTGQSGTITDLMPFQVAIGWDAEHYMLTENYGITTDPVTTAYFINDDASALEEPLYIFILPNNNETWETKCYVISEELFYEMIEIVPPAE